MKATTETPEMTMKASNKTKKCIIFDCSGPLPSPSDLARLVNTSAVMELISASITGDQRGKIKANLDRDVEKFIDVEVQVSGFSGKSPRIAVSIKIDQGQKYT